MRRQRTHYDVTVMKVRTLSYVCSCHTDLSLSHGELIVQTFLKSVYYPLLFIVLRKYMSMNFHYIAMSSPQADLQHAHLPFSVDDGETLSSYSLLE